MLNLDADLCGQPRHNVSREHVTQTGCGEDDERDEERTDVERQDPCGQEDRRQRDPEQPLVDSVGLCDRAGNEACGGSRRSRDGHQTCVAVGQRPLPSRRELRRKAEIRDHRRAALACARGYLEGVRVRKCPRVCRKAGKLSAIQANSDSDDPSLLPKADSVGVPLDNGNPREQ